MVLTVVLRVAWDNSTAKNVNLPDKGRLAVGIATETADHQYHGAVGSRGGLSHRKGRIANILLVAQVPIFAVNWTL